MSKSGLFAHFNSKEDRIIDPLDEHEVAEQLLCGPD